MSSTLSHTDHEKIIASGRRVLADEADALSLLRHALDNSFVEAVKIIAAAQGRVVVTGMGKSGHVSRKIAATLASTGCPAFFVHPGEASHGDLGMITAGDVVLALSNSGETVELGDIITYSRRFGIPLISMTRKSESLLATQSDVALILPALDEAGSMGLAPTTSTTMMLALGDALAVSLLELRNFSALDFKVFHPGGQLGRRLLKVADLMHHGQALPIVAPEAGIQEIILTITQKSLGCAGVVGPDGTLAGIITDGDLRRHLQGNFMGLKAKDVMTVGPKTATPDMLAAEALHIMNTKSITSLFVVTESKPVGVLHVHDCLRSGVA